jgi:hypothetical protein
MNQQIYVQAERQRFTRKTGFITDFTFKKFLVGTFILFVSVNLVVVILVKLFNGLAK